MVQRNLTIKWHTPVELTDVNIFVTSLVYNTHTLTSNKKHEYLFDVNAHTTHQWRQIDMHSETIAWRANETFPWLPWWVTKEMTKIFRNYLLSPLYLRPRVVKMRSECAPSGPSAQTSRRLRNKDEKKLVASKQLVAKKFCGTTLSLDPPTPLVHVLLVFLPTPSPWASDIFFVYAGRNDFTLYSYSPDLVKHLSHTSQVNGFLPVCVRRCIARWWCSEQVNVQRVQE